MQRSTHAARVSGRDQTGIVPAFCVFLLLSAAIPISGDASDPPRQTPCKVLADERVRDPVTAIVAEYQRRTGSVVTLECVPAERLNAAAVKQPAPCDVAVCLEDKDESCAVAGLAGSKKVAWKHPGGQPVWAAGLTDHPAAAAVFGFLGGPSGHRLWSASPAGFTMTTGKITALYENEEAVEAARKRIEAAGHTDRIRCQVGSIFNLPFQEGSFDVVAGAGPLLIWGDHVQGMREIYRVLRPGGAALVGGKYLYMPEWRRVPSDKLRESAAKSGISSIRVIDDMGQWVEVRKGIKDRGLAD